jgi:hypothetical protein
VPKVRIVTVDARSYPLAFRVYSDDDSPWTQAILKLLPDAFHKGQDMFNIRLSETAVFIFKDAARYTAFCRTAFESAPGSWAWASGGNGILFFCATDPKGNQPAKDVDSDYFRGTTAHEYTHALIARILGTAHLPTWLNEGLAEKAGSEVAPKLLAANDQEIQLCVASDMLLPLEKLNSADFYNEVEHQVTQYRTVGPSARVSDAYAQGFHMTRYLLSLVGMRRFCNFLAEFARTHSLDNSFQSVFGFSIPEFYDAWLEDVHKKYGEGSP